jgi:hypothetical protein
VSDFRLLVQLTWREEAVLDIATCDVYLVVVLLTDNL